METTIVISKDIHLSAITAGDAAYFVKHLNDPAISDSTLRIPFPYTEVDALKFVEMVQMQEMVVKKQMHWAIRTGNGELIGGIGLHGKYPETPHRDEVGYWIAKQYWGKGIMTGF